MADTPSGGNSDSGTALDSSRALPEVQEALERIVTLPAAQMQELAAKVLALLREDMRLERERFPRRGRR